MHPIEQLRFVARATGGDAELLIEEAASALTVFRSDRAGLLVAARRLLARQPALGPLWWLATRLLLADDVSREAAASVTEMQADQTARELAYGLPDGATVAVAGWPSLTVEALTRRGDVTVLVVDVDGQSHAAVRRLERADVVAEAIDGSRLGGIVTDCDLVLVEAGAAGGSAALVDVGSSGLAAAAHALGTPVWLVAGLGRRLPEPYWQRIVERVVDLDLPPWLQDNEIVTYGLVDRVVTGAGVEPVGAWQPGDLPYTPELLSDPI